MKYLNSMSWLFLEKILRLGIGFFVLTWMIRYLGPEQYGVYSFAQGFVFMFMAITTLGLDGIVVRELVKHPSLEIELLKTAWYLKFIGAIILVFIVFVSIKATSMDSNVSLYILIIAISTIFQSFNVLNFYFQYKIAGKYSAYTNIIVLLLSSIIKIILIMNEVSLIFFIYMIVIENVILALSYIYFYIKLSNNIQVFLLKFNKKIAKILLKNSWPLILTGIGYNIYSSIDKIMLYNMVDSISVGYYSTGVQLINAFIFLPTIFMNTIYPHLVSTYKTNKNHFIEQLYYIYRITIIVSFLFIISMFLFGKDITLLLYGDDYIETSNMIFLLSFSFLFESLAIINGRWIWIKNLQIISLYRTLFGAVFNILLNLYLIPEYGVYGAVYATLLTLFFAVVIFYIIFPQTREITKMQFYTLLTFYKLKGVLQWAKK